MYMPDALEAAIQLMEVDPSKLKHRNSFNVTAMSFCPEMIATEITKHLPDFVISYDINPIKQSIADSWPNKMDDTCAREEWGWNPKYDLAMMTEEMLSVIKKKRIGINLRRVFSCSGKFRKKSRRSSTKLEKLAFIKRSVSF
jgi:nucleoside-diphosphate-sugar epimerase